MMRGLVVAAVMVAPWIAGAAESLGTITILEGEMLMYRGTGRVQASEGVRLVPGDIVETAPATFVQIELADHSVMQFGPGTRALVNAGTSRQKAERWLYVMNGWAKVAGADGKAGGGPGFEVRTRQFWMAPMPATIVFQTGSAETTLFVERGDVRLAEQEASGPAVAVALRQGDYYRRKGPGRGSVNAEGAGQAMLAGMPRPFRDSLPMRIDRFRDQEAKPKPAPDFSYADVEDWLKADPWLRRPLMQRWRTKAKEPAFRASLIANLSAHPEWDPILFPEKYLPKTPPPRRAAQPASEVALPSRP